MKEVNYTESFYIAITYLFYAMSMADKTMAAHEKRSIVKSIRKDWATTKNGFNSEELMYNTMRTLIKKELTAETAFKEFKRFVEIHNDFFNEEIKYHLLEASYKICNAHAGKNKSEVIILTKLDLLFNTEKLL
ncbi:hypothetical protein [Tenacibaculum maritimum]|uniref:hypothetical protein n=1 Tax=Tenacibaculum maritimum TaxID=107401 RepID=UPI0012E45D26|nr:hypothetical protein [Tenacibaculum maritimum]CAA0224088.1 conserved hypothetical protein [Tenacibaculum maritimum]